MLASLLIVVAIATGHAPSAPAAQPLTYQPLVCRQGSAPGMLHCSAPALK